MTCMTINEVKKHISMIFFEKTLNCFDGRGHFNYSETLISHTWCEIEVYGYYKTQNKYIFLRLRA